MRQKFKNLITTILLASVCIIAQADRFVKLETPAPITAGLQDRNIALWNSHGRYYNNEQGRWMWQRCRVMTTVEDLYTSTYVLPYLVPMLERAGAYVIMPRERDRSAIELVIDGDGGHATGRYIEHNGREKWRDSDRRGFAYLNDVLADRENPFEAGKARIIKTEKDSTHLSTATWSASIPEAGEFAVYVSYQSLPDSRTATYTIHAADGDHTAHVNQAMGGGTWVYVGTYRFEQTSDSRPIVKLSNHSPEKGHISADAVRIGGGYGNVGRRNAPGADYITSGLPRWAEGARYYLQWVGVPDSIYSSTEYVSDYNDDYASRGKWVNWLARGSRAIPDETDGLGIPIDLSFALHSDAGTTDDDSFVGTLGIYSTDGGRPLGDGSSRSACRDLAQSVVSQVTSDIRALYAPAWEQRKMRDRRYAEARAPQVPAMLLELLSHQNFADMSLGLDPAFRRDVSRSIYKGILKFVAARNGTQAVVQPLAVNHFKITSDAVDPQSISLSWQPVPDPLEPSAHADSYIVEERSDNGLWREVARTTMPSWQTRVNDNKLHSWRVTALNAGGSSEPSEVLSAAIVNSKAPDVLIVNGFTRVGPPDRFDYGPVAGFGMVDNGVADIKDIGYTGRMTEYRRTLPWIDDENPGFGASDADFELTEIAGNTHDFVAVHGRSVADTGHSFVSASADAYADSNSVDLRCYHTIDLILGKQRQSRNLPGDRGPRYKTFTPAMQQALAEHTSRGGSLLVSGAYVATDLFDNPHSSPTQKNEDAAFAADVLGIGYRKAQATATGEVSFVPSRLGEIEGSVEFEQMPNSDIYAVESADAIIAASAAGGEVFMRYGDSDLPAAVVTDNGVARTVVFGYPLEVITDRGRRAQLFKLTLNYLTD